MKKRYFLIFLVIISIFLPVGSTSALTTTELYNNAANNIFFYVKGDDACDPSTLAQYVATVTGDQVTWIGDAWSVYARLVIEAKYPGISIFAEEGRTFDETSGELESGIDVVKRLAEANTLRKYVVFELGANGGASKTEEEAKTMISDLLSAVGSERKVVLLTIRTRTQEYEEFNKAVKSMESNEQVLVADFANMVKDNIDTYFEEGKDSLNENGLKMMAGAVVATFEKYTDELKSKATSTIGTTLSQTVVATTTSADSDANALIIAQWLRGAGYDGDAIAAILGNLQGESGIIPNKLEGGELVTDPAWKVYDWSLYGTGKKGFGLAQWTTTERLKNLQEFADKNGLPVIGLEAQTGHLIDELKSATYKSRVEDINGKGLEYANYMVWRYYETPGSSFWTTHKGKYYNSCAPTGLNEGSCPLSKDRTPAAYDSFTTRLGYAKHYLELIEASGIAQGSGIQWSGGGAGGTGGAICSTNLQGAMAIAQLAREMSWPDNNGLCLDSSGAIKKWENEKSSCSSNPRDKYKEVVSLATSKGESCTVYQDCACFVINAVRYLGLDEQFTKGSKWAIGGSGKMWQYFNDDDARSLWAIVPNDGENTSVLMPGDIAVYPNAYQIGRSSNPKAFGHVQIYVGDLGGSFGKVAAASAGQWVGRVHNVNFLVHGDNGAGFANYTVVRYKGSASYYDTPVEEEIPEGGPEEEVPQPTDSNECGGNTESKGISYKDQMTDSKLQDIGKVLQNFGCNSISACRATASFLANRYEHLGSPGGDVHKWIVNNYTLADTGGHDLSTGSNALMGAKYVFNTKGAQDGKGNRTLAGNVYEMLQPDQMSLIKIDGTTGSKPSTLTDSDYAKLKQGVSKGITTGYSKDLDFYCANKGINGKYKYLFWSYTKTPEGQELK